MVGLGEKPDSIGKERDQRSKQKGGASPFRVDKAVELSKRTQQIA